MWRKASVNLNVWDASRKGRGEGSSDRMTGKRPKTGKTAFVIGGGGKAGSRIYSGSEYPMLHIKVICPCRQEAENPFRESTGFSVRLIPHCPERRDLRFSSALSGLDLLQNISYFNEVLQSTTMRE